MAEGTAAAVDRDAVEDAARRLAGVASVTPLIASEELDTIAAGTVLLKAESLQLTGSFKIRGAYNLMSRLTPAQAARGVVAWSSGNHAQGVAAAGARLGIRTAIVMPEDAPALKLENTRRLGGETVLYDRYSGDREAIARALDACDLAELGEREVGTLSGGEFQRALLARAISLLSNMNGTPVLISTHSDRVLELIDNPAEALRVCELDGSRATISQLDPDKLAPWLARYGDLGQLRASGYLHRALVPSPEQEDA